MKAIKKEIAEAIENLKNKRAVEVIKQHFYLESIKATCYKTCETYGFDEGFDMSLELVSDLLAHNMISLHEALKIMTEITFMDYDKKEGENHGKN